MVFIPFFGISYLAHFIRNILNHNSTTIQPRTNAIVRVVNINKANTCFINYDLCVMKKVAVALLILAILYEIVFFVLANL